MSNVAIEKLLVELLNPAGAAKDFDNRLGGLDADKWDLLDQRASDHRLRPFLYHAAIEQAAIAIPESIAARWRDTARASMVEALLHQRDLVRTVTLLRGAGIEPIALKGAGLAFTAYPMPGLRPMRDLDLWVESDKALKAYHVLLADGYQATSPGDPQSLLDDHHQLPTLLAPGGDTQIEIHTRLFHEKASEDPAMDPTFRSRSQSIDVAGTPITVPSPEDQLLHLVVHAAYDHRFDNGPITLPDIAHLASRHSIDWPLYHESTGRYRRGSDALLALVRQYWPTAPIPAQTNINDQQVEMMVSLMTQDLGCRDQARLLESKSVGHTIFPDRQRMSQLYGTSAKALWPLSWLIHWSRLIAQRLPRFLSGRRDPEVQELAGLDHAYRSWLAEKP